MIQSPELLADRLGRLLMARQLRVTTAESCTGGLIAAAITAIAGSSQWFDQGIVSYSNQVKQNLLQVAAADLDLYGAVSQSVVTSMATGALISSGADMAIVTSGIAGPDGGSEEKPVGTVWFAWGMSSGCRTELCHFAGDRTAVRTQAVNHALERAIELLKNTV